jgi:hypothetical protein
MTCNVGGIERPIRIGAGLLAITIGLFAGFSTAIAGTALGWGHTAAHWSGGVLSPVHVARDQHLLSGVRYEEMRSTL